MAFVLQLFGGFRLTGEDGQPIIVPDKARALIAFLAVAPFPVARQALAEALSEDGTESEQRATVRRTLYLARQAMADGAAIRNRGGDLVLDDALVRADARQFMAAATRGDQASLRDAGALYRGPFLEGEKAPSTAFEAWLAARRAEFQERAVEVMLTLSRADAAAGLNGSALVHARRALTLDPLREDAHRQVMSCLAAMGQRSSALRHYEMARQLLLEELGVMPEDATKALHAAIAAGEDQAKADLGLPYAAHGEAAAPARILAPGRVSVFRAAMVALALILILSVGATAWYSRRKPDAAFDPPSVAVMPFTNGAGDAAQVRLAHGIAESVTTMLSAHPGIRVISQGKRDPLVAAVGVQQPGEGPVVRYVLEGSIRASANGIQITTQLLDAATGDHLWARAFDVANGDAVYTEEQIANQIYEQLVGFTGEIERHEQRHAWRKPTANLGEQDYMLRGGQFYFQFTREAHSRAKHIWRGGLAAFPESARLRIRLAAAYVHAVEVRWSENSSEDLERACRLSREAGAFAQRSRFDQWLSHLSMAKLLPWCEEDFKGSVAQARAAVKLAPYDATSRANLAEFVANAGKTKEAVEWLEEAMRRDPQGPEWYSGNLAWALYLAERYDEALAESNKLNKPRRPLLAALYARLGNLEAAAAAVAAHLRDNPGYTLAEEARRPLIGSLKRRWLEDLRKAGMPAAVVAGNSRTNPPPAMH